MPATRAALDAELTARRGAAAARCGVTDFAWPTTRALRALGADPADPAAPADADLADLAAADVPYLSDLADLFLLEACVGNWARADQKVSLGEQKWGAYGEFLRGLLNDARAHVKALYGYGTPPPSPGSTDSGFAATGCWWEGTA